MAQAAPVSPAEIVRLTSGAEYKGQIAERVPESHVVIVTITGEVKRFEWSEVSFAGPLETPATVVAVEPSAPSQEPATEAPPKAQGPRLELQANRQGIMWHAEDEQGATRLLCTAPCTANVAPGRYRLGLSTGSREPRWDVMRYQIAEDASFSGVYTSRRGSRIAGGVILGVGLPGALWAIAVGARANGNVDKVCSTSSGAAEACDEVNADSAGKGLIITGVITGVVSAFLGLVLVSRSDEAAIHPNGNRLQTSGNEPEPEPVSVGPAE